VSPPHQEILKLLHQQLPGYGFRVAPWGKTAGATNSGSNGHHCSVIVALGSCRFTLTSSPHKGDDPRHFCHGPLAVIVRSGIWAPSRPLSRQAGSSEPGVDEQKGPGPLV
ncbi:uncharacterized protein METZ01_LOCUS194089, partial [marine metagenome]